MAHSNYLSSLNTEQYKKLISDLHNRQNGKCFICRNEIDLDVEEVDIDHVEPLKMGGKDSPNNFALTHSGCNRRKQDADLRVAQVLENLSQIQKESSDKTATLAEVLKYFDGSKGDPNYKIEDDLFIISFGDSLKKSYPIFTDKLSGEKSVFIEAPIEYIYHDELINPRGINKRIGGLIKEFYKGNPQLQVCLARIDDGRIKIFDGQHKAAAQLLLGVRNIPMRLFVDPDVQRLTTANTNAGSKLKQVAFDKSIMHQLSNTLYRERIARYQREHDMGEDEYAFSEQALIDYFKGQDLRKYIIDSQKKEITNSKDNRLSSYINFDGRMKELPISYSTFDKAFLSKFIDSKHVLATALNYRMDEGRNPRDVERKQIVRLINILADRIYVDRFDPEVGTNKIEDRVAKGKDAEITNEHLAAYRMSKEEIISAFIPYLLRLIETTLTLGGCNYQESGFFMTEFPENVWDNVENFVDSYAGLPLWIDRSLSETIFSGKQNKSYWDDVFATGKTPDGKMVLEDKLDIMEMAKAK